MHAIGVNKLATYADIKIMNVCYRNRLSYMSSLLQLPFLWHSWLDLWRPVKVARHFPCTNSFSYLPPLSRSSPEPPPGLRWHGTFYPLTLFSYLPPLPRSLPEPLGYAPSVGYGRYHHHIKRTLTWLLFSRNAIIQGSLQMIFMLMGVKEKEYTCL